METICRVVARLFGFEEPGLSKDSAGPALTCAAVQYSDAVVCSCGNVWDVNDLDQPKCRMVRPRGIPMQGVVDALRVVEFGARGYEMLSRWHARPQSIAADLLRARPMVVYPSDHHKIFLLSLSGAYRLNPACNREEIAVVRHRLCRRLPIEAPLLLRDPEGDWVLVSGDATLGALSNADVDGPEHLLPVLVYVLDA